MSSSSNHHENRTQQPQHSRAVTVPYLICIICFFSYGCAEQFTEDPGLAGPGASGGGSVPALGAHLFEDPPQYQQMTFDTKHRGGYNISKCTNDLFNCWEIITPEEFCYYTTEMHVATTMCDRMRIYCTHNGYDADDYLHIFDAREYECDYQGDLKTRRRRGPGDRMYVMPWSAPRPGIAQLQALRLQMLGNNNLPLPMPSPRPDTEPDPERDAAAPASPR